MYLFVEMIMVGENGVNGQNKCLHSKNCEEKWTNLGGGWSELGTMWGNGSRWNGGKAGRNGRENGEKPLKEERINRVMV